MVRLKVLMLTPEFLPVYGGVGNYVLKLAENFPEDIDVHIVTPRSKDVAGDGAGRKIDSNPSPRKH